MEDTPRSRWGISQFLNSPEETRNSPLGYKLTQTKLYKKSYLSESFHLPPACHCHFLSCQLKRARPGKHPTLLQTDLPQAGGNIQTQLSAQHIVFLPVMHTTEISTQEDSWAPDTKCKTYVKVPWNYLTDQICLIVQKAFTVVIIHRAVIYSVQTWSITEIRLLFDV